MRQGPLGITPPNDTGSDTFRRYRYQAEVAFPFCVDCALVGNVVSVIPEHFEDVAIEFADGSWRMIQIKTRDPGQVPWTLATVLGSDGGALKSLLRTHRALARFSGRVSYELRLEGAIRRDDDAHRLTVGGDGATAEMVRVVGTKLGIDEAEVVAFLSHLTIRDGEPSRDAIEAVNLRKLGLAASAASVAVVREVYRRVIERIDAAMDRRLADDRWPAAVVDDAVATEADRATLAGKRLTRELLGPLFGPLGSTEPTLLTQIADPDTHTSALEDKLAAWGASRAVIDDAKLLRAHASVRETEVQASSLLGGSDLLEDLRIRLRVVANAAAAEVGGTMSADRVWAVLQSRLHDQRHSLDQHGLLKSDPMLLLGEVCQLSDLCEYDWGRPRA